MSKYQVTYHHNSPKQGGNTGIKRVECETEATAIKIVSDEIQLKYPNHIVTIKKVVIIK